MPGAAPSFPACSPSGGVDMTLSPSDQGFLITQPSQLSLLFQALSAQPAVAVDTESNSFYAYRERICLIQFSTPAGDYIVDPLAGLDLEVLGRLFADPAVQKVFHAAAQDVAGLKRDFGFHFANLFDTMLAARILGWKQTSLSDLVQEHFGIHLEKRYQRYDWGRRPLSPEALAYAWMDTRYLLPLRDIQADELAHLERSEEAAEAFAEVAQTPPSAPPTPEESFWRIKGVYDLDGSERAVLWELHRWRDGVAQVRDRPLFKVMRDEVLVALAQARPRTRAELARIRGLSPHLLRRNGTAILAAIARGQRRPAPSPPLHRRPPDEVLERYETLRDWRRRVAAQRQVEADVILSNATLMALAQRNPASLEEMEEIGGLGPWKRRTYGPEILRVLTRLEVGGRKLEGGG